MRKLLILFVAALFGLSPMIGCKEIYPCSLEGPVARPVLALSDAQVRALLDELSGPACVSRCKLQSTAEWGVRWQRAPEFRRHGTDGRIDLAWCFDEGLGLRITDLDRSDPIVVLKIESATHSGQSQIWPR